MFKKIVFIITIAALLLPYKTNIGFSETIYEEIIQEEKIYEEIIQEEKIYEEIIQEEKIYEEIIHEMTIFEETIYKDAVIEDKIFEYGTVYDLKNNNFISPILGTNIDWGSIASKYAIGSSIIVITAILSVVSINTPLHCVFITSFKGSVAGALSGMAMGGAVESGIQILKKEGSVNSAKEYAIKGSADGFMWGAIIGAVGGSIKGYTDFKNVPFIKTDNMSLAGKLHPKTGIPFITKYVKDKYGNWFKIVVAKFPYKVQVKLPMNIASISNRDIHFKKATDILREQIKRNTKLEGKFSKDQLIDIMNGRSKISGLTWHHNEEKGVMQLVEDVIHSQTGHTGGFSIWQRL